MNFWQARSSLLLDDSLQKIIMLGENKPTKVDLLPKFKENIGTRVGSTVDLSQLLENSQLTLMEEWRGWCATFTQPLHSSEQHIRANLEFSSNFGIYELWGKLGTE